MLACCLHLQVTQAPLRHSSLAPVGNADTIATPVARTPALAFARKHEGYASAGARRGSRQNNAFGPVYSTGGLFLQVFYLLTNFGRRLP